tara:strand:+ start:112 stop:1299 length:1188 start_codon:yes stop_codon:yes gene_type:complete
MSSVERSNLPIGWEEKQLGEVAIYDKSKYTENNRPYVGLEHIETNTSNFLGDKDAVNVKSSTFKFDTRHVLYGRLRPYLNKVLVPDFKGHCSTEIFPILPNEQLIRRYLCYWLMSPETNSKINATWTGARMPRANMNDVIKFKIPVPPLKEQKRIVAKIETLFAKIDKAISLTEESLVQAKNLLPSVLKEVFEKGKADGWEEKKLQDICEKITDGTHQTPTYFEEGVVFLSSKNVTSGKINWDNVKYIDDAQHQKMHKRVSPKRKDILLAKNGTTGVAAMVDRDIVFDIYVSLAHIRSLGDLIPELLLYYINSPLAKSQFNKRLKGVGVPNLHLREIREVLVVFPNNKEVQLELVKFLDEALNQSKQTQSKLEEQLVYLKQLKSSILSKAFKGEL